jgi:hypothetical protein
MGVFSPREKGAWICVILGESHSDGRGSVRFFYYLIYTTMYSVACPGWVHVAKIPQPLTFDLGVLMLWCMVRFSWREKVLVLPSVDYLGTR